MTDARRWAPFAVLAAAVVYAALGIAGLGDQSLWLDEEMSLNIATASRQQILLWFSNHPEQHPLYYAILRAWTKAFGTSELTLRSLSLLFGILAIPLTWKLGRQLAGELEGATASILLALSPFWLFYGQEGRMYTLLVALVLLSSLLALEEARRSDRARVRVPWRYWLVAACGMYTHFFFGFVVLAHAVALLLRSPNWKQNAARALFLGFPVLLAYSPWLVFTAVHMPSGQDWKGMRHVVFGIPYTILRFAIGYAELPTNYRWQERLSSLLAGNAPLLVAAALAHGTLFVAGAAAMARRARVEVVFTWSCLVLPLVLPLALAPVIILTGERYFMVVLPFYLVVLAAGMVRLLRPGPSAVLRGAALLLFVIVTVRSLYAYHGNPEFGKEQWKEVVGRIEAARPQGNTLVLVAPDMSEGVLDYYLDETPELRLEPWRPGEELAFGDIEFLWIVVTRLFDPQEVVSSLPAGWTEVSRQLFPKDTGIWLIGFQRTGG